MERESQDKRAKMNSFFQRDQRRIDWWIIGLGVTAAAVSLGFKSPKISLSMLAGSVISFANFVLLRQIVVRLIRTELRKPAAILWRLGLKMMLLAAMIVAVTSLPIDGAAFLVGITTTVIAVIVGGLQSGKVSDDA